MIKMNDGIDLPIIQSIVNAFISESSHDNMMCDNSLSLMNAFIIFSSVHHLISSIPSYISTITFITSHSSHLVAQTTIAVTLELSFSPNRAPTLFGVIADF